MKKRITIWLFLLCCTLGAFAQDDVITVTGNVKDELGEPLIGANITIKNEPGMGTITDVDGNFRMKVESYKVLVFSFIGYDTQEVPIKGRKVVNVQMKLASNSVLDEVVITGMGAQKKATLTGAITSVNMSELKKSSGASGNITNALAGNVAGIIAMQTSGEPGNNTSEFWIRGISTFGAGSSALILVDGFERSLNEINTEDIESFSVLKDAAATAIYGSKGANGVVLITTKRGQAGKVNINAKVESSYNTRTRTPEFVDGLTYAEMLNEARVTRNMEAYYTSAEMEILRKGLDPDLYPNVDWMDLLLKDGAWSTRAVVDLSGGGSTARYFVSASFQNEGGMYNNDSSLKNDYNTNANNKLWTYRMNVDMDLTKTTLLKVGVSGSLRKQNQPGLEYNMWELLTGQTPVSVPIVYSDGRIPAYGTGSQTNPWVVATQTGYREWWENKIQTNVTLEQKLDFITKGLRFVGRFGYDTNNKTTNKRIKWPEQWKAEPQRDSNGNLVMNRVTEERVMYMSSDAEGDRNENFEAELHYDRTVANRHHLGGTFKYHQKQETFTVGINEDMIKGIARRNQGIAGRFTYSYDYRYFFDFNFGYNGTENLAKGHQFGFFPAISLAWNIAEEKWVKEKLSWIEMFKVRYSYGEVGNDKMGDNVRFPYIYTIGNEGASGWDFGDVNSAYWKEGMHYQAVAAQNLTWEKAKKHDLGVDISLWNGKFSLTADIYKDIRDGIYMQRTHLTSIVGVTNNPWANVGKMESSGFDGNFMLNHKLGEVDFTLRGNLTYTKNKVLEYDEANEFYPYLKKAGFRWEQTRGLIALGLFKDYEEIRNSPTQQFGEVMPGDIKYKDVNGDGVVNDEDVVPIGSTRTPNLIYGVGLSARWKGLDINVHFQGAGQSSYMLSGWGMMPFSGGTWGNVLTDMAVPGNRWISAEISGDPATENPNAKYPRLSYGGNSNNYRESTFWMRSGAYLRFKTLEIGYTLPKAWTNKVRMGDVRFYFLGNNLCVWDSLKLWDPELASSDGMKYPLSRSFTLGVTFGI